MKRLACLALLAWLGGGVSGALAQQDLTRDQVAAYVALTKADRARERGDLVAAEAAYEDALAKYTAIKERDPRWHPDVVGYRMNYCVQQLKRLEEPAPSPESAPSAAEPVAPVEVSAAVAQTSGEVESLRAQVAELQVATQTLARLESDLSSVTAERDRLRARVTELESAPPVIEPAEELRAALEQAYQELAQAKTTAQEAVEAKAREVEPLERQVDAQLALLKNAQAEQDRSREQFTAAVAAAEQERDQARAELEAARADGARATPELTATQESLRTTEAELADARQALAECQKQTAIRLKAYEAAQKERDELAPQMREARQQMAEMQSALKALQAKEAERTVGNKKQVEELRKEVARLKAGLPTPTDMESALNDQLDSLSRQLRAVRAEATDRAMRIEQLEGELEALRKAP